MSVPSVRDRRRAETVAEIKEAALRELLDAGPGGFSLRGVARAVGMARATPRSENPPGPASTSCCSAASLISATVSARRRSRTEETDTALLP